MAAFARVKSHLTQTIKSLDKEIAAKNFKAIKICFDTAQERIKKLKNYYSSCKTWKELNLVG